MTLATRERDEALDEAVAAGKFSADRRVHYERLWDTNPAATRELLDGMHSPMEPHADYMRRVFGTEVGS